MIELYYSLVFTAVFWMWCIFAIEKIDGNKRDNFKVGFEAVFVPLLVILIEYLVRL